MTRRSPGSRCFSTLSVPTRRSSPLPSSCCRSHLQGWHQLNLGCTGEKCLHSLRGRTSPQPRHVPVSSLVAGWPAGRFISSSSGLRFFLSFHLGLPLIRRSLGPSLSFSVLLCYVYSLAPISDYWVIPLLLCNPGLGLWPLIHRRRDCRPHPV